MGLVVSRKLKERIRVDLPASAVPQEAWIEVVEIKPGKVRLKLSAHDAVGFMREELLPEEERFVEFEKTNAAITNPVSVEPLS